MNIINTLVNKIFHPSRSNAEPQQGIPSSIAAPVEDPSSSTLSSSASSSQESSPVDVEQVLNAMQKKMSTTLNWRTSIVDLMKLLDMDSGLEARKQLAQELGYNGSTSDTASMNTWLHKAVMKRVADNGGRLPDDLKH